MSETTEICRRRLQSKKPVITCRITRSQKEDLGRHEDIKKRYVLRRGGKYQFVAPYFWISILILAIILITVSAWGLYANINILINPEGAYLLPFRGWGAVGWIVLFAGLLIVAILLLFWLATMRLA